MNFKKITLLLAVTAMHLWMTGQSFEDTRRLSRTFKVTESTLVDINNKYGDVMVSTWDKDSVKIEITRYISEKSEDRLKRLRDNIDFTFSELTNYLSATTVLGSKHSTILQDVKEATNYLSASESGSKIDYKVTIPVRASIKITNKYGDVILPALSGNVTVDLANGDIQTRELTGLTSLTLSFGNAQIKQLSHGSLTGNFVNATLNQAGNLTADTKSSTLRIDRVDVGKFTSRRDQITLSTASQLTLDGYFTKLTAAIASSASIKMTYGELIGLTLTEGFKKCDVVNQSCDTRLILISPAAYNAFIKAPNTNLSLPSGLNAETAVWQKTIQSQPVRFVWQKKQTDDKLKINISDADLKIIHQ